MEVLLDIVVICSHFSIFETLETTDIGQDLDRIQL